MKRMLWLGLFGIIGMSASGIGLAASDNAAAAKVVSATGVVVQVKADQGRVKIDHDPIPALDWPRMTMFFRVKDQAVLAGIAAGDKVRFELEKGATGLVITSMQKTAK